MNYILEISHNIEKLRSLRNSLSVSLINYNDEERSNDLRYCIEQFDDVIKSYNLLKSEIVRENIDIRDNPIYPNLSNKINNIEKSVNSYTSDYDYFREKNLDRLDKNILITSMIYDLLSLLNNLTVLISEINVSKDFLEINDVKNDVNERLTKFENSYETWKIKEIHEIFKDDSNKFNKLARQYELAFYSVIAILVFYFLGLTFYINDFHFLFIEMGFPEKNHGKISPEFYIQKISLLVLSTTLAAFLLKRSFMNRKLADEAYRTAKELDALPRYMEGMSEEMKEKIRFDLAYKYFGNAIHHESYTGGENLMHENIKANTDFIKAVKDLTPKAEVPKADKAPKDAA